MKNNPALYQIQALTTTSERNRALASGSKTQHAARFQHLIDERIAMMNGIANKLSRPDRTRTDAANFLDMSRAAKITIDAAWNAIKSAQRISGEIYREIEQKEDAQLGFKRGNQDRAAIIAKFSTLNQPDQQTQIGVWLSDKANGGAMIGLISEADPFLTGLSPEQSARLRSDFVKSHAPDLADEREEVAQAVNNVLAAHHAVKLVTDEVMDERLYNEIVHHKAQSDADNAVFVHPSATT